jgi:hypothetical protein
MDANIRPLKKAEMDISSRHPRPDRLYFLVRERAVNASISSSGQGAVLTSELFIMDMMNIH